MKVTKFPDQLIDSDIKYFEEIRKLTTAKSQHYATRCSLDYDYIKNHYSLIAVDFSKQKGLVAAPKAFRQIGFVGKLKQIDINSNATDNSNDQSMFILTILEKKIKETTLKFSQESVMIL